jgi:hypothetical protein
MTLLTFLAFWCRSQWSVNMANHRKWRGLPLPIRNIREANLERWSDRGRGYSTVSERRAALPWRLAATITSRSGGGYRVRRISRKLTAKRMCPKSPTLRNIWPRAVRGAQQIAELAGAGAGCRSGKAITMSRNPNLLRHGVLRRRHPDPGVPPKLDMLPGHPLRDSNHVRRRRRSARIKAPSPGLEPELSEPKSDVLPITPRRIGTTSG